MKKLFKFLIAIFLGFSLASCATTSSLQSVRLDKETMIMEVGQTETLVATVNPQELSDDTQILWDSSNTKVATVDQNGVVTAIAAGSCKITVTASRGLARKKDICTIKVLPDTIPVDGITLDITNERVDVGDTLLLTPTISPIDATNKEVIWSSSDGEIASVEDGLVTANKVGNATITATTVDGDKEATCTITVYQSVSSVELDKLLNTVNVGDSFELVETVLPIDATNKEVTWTSSNSHVASVNDGLVNAVAPGIASITVTTVDGGHTATCVVTVLQPVASVSLNETTLSLVIGGEKALEATVLPNNASNKAVVWSSSDESVVTVENGLVKAVSAGSATVTVTTIDGNKTATCTVTVTQPVTGVTLNKTTLDLLTGENETLIASISPIDATNKEVTWTSSDENVATVVNGKVVAIGPGSATVTVTTVDGNKTATCAVTVVRLVEEVSLNKQAHTININDSFELEATVLPADASNKAVTWTSSDTSVATVVDGVVTAHKEGKATITVKTVDGGFEASCIVTVRVYVEGVTLNKEEVTLGISEKETLIASVLPANATNKNVTWSSSNEDVAIVDGGRITAVTPGETIITVTTAEGNYEATCVVTVIRRVTSISLNKEEAVVGVGENLTLEATVLPTNATIKDVTWTSSNPSVVTVVNGEVVGVAVGEAIITATTVDGGFEATCLVEVSNFPTSVEITNGNEAILDVNETVTLEVVVLPNNAFNKEVTWTSSNENVATVENGLVRAITPGEAIITVTTVYGGKVDTFVVTVTQPVTSVGLDKTSVTILEGQESSLRATVLPFNASNKEVIWSSEDENVATVENGVIHAVSEGSTSVKVTTVDGGFEATCAVTVVKEAIPATSVEISQAQNITAIKVDDTLQLSASVLPNNTTNTTAWYSTDTNIATVDKFGLVTAHNEGSVTIVVSVGTVMDSYSITVSKHTPVITLDGQSITYLDEYEFTPTSDCEEEIVVEYYTVVDNQKGEKLNAKPTEVGEYIVVASILSTYKYNAVSKEVRLSINKKQLDMSEVVWSDHDFTYDTQEKIVVLLNLPDEVTVNYQNNTKTIVGEYEATFTFTYDTHNYELINNTVASLDWEIKQASIDMQDVKWNYSEAFTYNGTEREVTLVNVPALVSVSYEDNKATNAGTYTAVATLTYDTHNYKLINNTVEDLTWIINKVVVARPAADERVFTYNGVEHTYVLTTKEGIYTITGTLTRTNAGTTTITVSLDDPDNYEWDNETIEDLEFNFVINKAKVAKPVVSENLVYNTQVQTGVTLDNNCSVVSGVLSATDAGTYDLIVKLDDPANYEWADGTVANIEVSYTIAHKKVNEPTVKGTYTYNKAEQTLQLNGYDADYMSITGNKATNAGNYEAIITLNPNYVWENGADGRIAWSIAKVVVTRPDAIEDEFVYNFEEQTYDLPTSDYYTISGNKATNVSVNTVVVELKDKANYVWDDDTVANLEYEFEIKTLVVEVPDVIEGLVYDGTAHTLVAPTIYYTVSGGVQTYAGTHYVTLYLVNGNLAWDNPSFDGILRFEIAKADYDMSGVEWDYEGPFTYNNEAYGVQLINLPDGVTVDGYQNHTGTNVGTYVANVLAFRYDATNYNNPMTYYNNYIKSKTWVINERTITVNINNASSTYSEEEAALTFEITQGSLATGHNAQDVFTLSRVSGTDAGEYAISLNKVNNNYVVNFNNDAKYTISPKELTIPTAATGLIYDGTAKTGVADGEGYSVTNGAAINANTYTAVVSLDSTTNYVWEDETTTSKEVTYTIAKREIEVTVDNKSITYGDDEVALTYIVTGELAPGHTNADVFNVSRVAGTDVNTYDITVTTLNTNYAITSNVGSYVINKRTITGITFVGNSFKYDGNPHSIEISGSLPTGVNVTYTPTNEYTEKGVYQVTATFTDTTGNYNVPAPMEATLEIYVVVTGVTLDKDDIALEVGETAELSADIIPGNANIQDVSWESSDETVATVVNGVVTALKEGDAIITVTTVDGEFTDTCVVTVSKVDVTGVSITPAIVEMKAGSTTTLIANVLPDNATNKVVTWTSSNPDVAEIDEETGVVTAKTSGYATITVTTADGNKTATSEVIVMAEDIITVNIADYATANNWVDATQYNSINIGKGINVIADGEGNTGKYYNNGTNWRIYQNENPTVTISSNSNIISAIKITYTNSNTGILTFEGNNIESNSIVEVNTSSVEFGVGNTNDEVTNGQVRIIAIEVTYLVRPLKGVALDKTTATVELNKTIKLNAILTPSENVNTNVTWESDNESIATVDQNGVVTGKQIDGTTTITVTTVEGGHTATCTVTVVRPTLESIVLSTTNLDLVVGALPVEIIATANPAEALLTGAVWHSENESVATVEDGVVTAVGAGETDIVITVGDISATCTVNVTAANVSVTGVEISSINNGSTLTLQANVLPNNATNKTVTWTSSNPDVAEVDEETGVVTAKTSGYATITVTTEDGGYTAVCNISVPNGTWKKINVGDIKSTDVVVITWTTSNGTTYAMSNDNGTGAAPTAVVVTVDGNQLSGDIADNIKWNITNDNGNLTIYPNGEKEKWLYSTSSNNGIRVGTSAEKTFNITDNYLYNIERTRYVGVYNNADIRSYTTIHTNIADQTLIFYKYSLSIEIVCEHTNTTTTTIDATCTEAGSITVTCDDCEEVISTEEIPATGHTFIDGECHCGEIEELQCEHTNTTTTITATCTEDGTTTVTCDDCGETISTEVTLATGHEYVDGTCNNCGNVKPKEWTKVTDVSTLEVGDQIVIVAKDYNYALSTTQNSNNRGQAAVTKVDNTITFGEDVQVLTLEAGTSSGTFAFNTGAGYLYAASSSSNYLRTETTLSANSSWEIIVAVDGTATIVAQGTNTRNTMQYNQSSSLFACYSSASQRAVVIYKLG